MDSQLVVFLTAIITTTITALISGIFGIIWNQIQAQSAKLTTLEAPKILLPPGVEIRKPIKTPRKFFPRFAMFVIGGLIVGIILGFILQGSQPTGSSPSRAVLIRIAYVMAGFVIVGIVVFGIMLSRDQNLGARKWSVTLAVSVTLILVLTTSYFMLSAFLEERTVYFVVDVSANAEGLSKEIFTRVNLGFEQIPDNVNIGLAIFGGNIVGQSGCNDITELVSPAPKQESIPQIEKAINNLSIVTPSGDSALQNSIIYALSRLAGRRGEQQIFVVTASVDSRCGVLDRKFLDSIAAQSDTKYEIVVVHVGEISDTDSKILIAFANRFVNVSTTAELSNVIQEVLDTPSSIYQIYQQVYDP